jgi:hypothetical protein
MAAARLCGLPQRRIIELGWTVIVLVKSAWDRGYPLDFLRSRK